jgi:carbamoyl-phosphate synthase/aspartate carbamoyltransferase
MTILKPIVKYEPSTLPAFSQVESSSLVALTLKDGTIFEGISFGHCKNICGECVFQTGMVGYTESLTDPSYAGQILVLTYPLVGNYGVPEESIDPHLNLAKYFESSKIHIAGLVVGRYTDDFSHYLAKSSLGDWLKKYQIPAIYGVDTRALTKKIRNEGVMLAKMLFHQTPGMHNEPILDNIEWNDPNERNLVSEVSCKSVQFFPADPTKVIYKNDKKPLKVLAVDVGIVYINTF